MNKSEFEVNWEQLKISAKLYWSELSNDDLSRVAGNREKLVSKIQEKYGFNQLEAEKQIIIWELKTEPSFN